MNLDSDTSLELTHVGGSKVRRYGWQIVDEKGELRYIEKHKLKIDKDYQRDLVAESKVLDIARAWSWKACGVISVAKRFNEYFVFDGQYRTLAAMRRSDITVLPCVVFNTENQKQEAHAFLQANKNRKPITSLDAFKAMKVDNNTNALFVDELLRKYDRVPAPRSSNAKGSARCLTALLSCADANREVLSRIFPIANALCADRELHSHILRALFYIEQHVPESISLTQARWKDRLMLLGFTKIIGAARNAANFRERGGERVWAEGILQLLNKGAKKKIVLVERKRVGEAES